MLYLSTCPVCQGGHFEAFLSCEDYTVSHETFHLQQCRHCGFVLTNPRPDLQDLSKYYNSDAYISHSDKSSNLIDHAYKICRNFTMRWKHGLIRKHSLRPPASVLDYGCGTGAFLRECQKHKMRIAGVEPSRLARQQAEKNTYTTIFPDLPGIVAEFDVISLWHVLEHVPELNETIHGLKTRLRQNGTMFIAVPNLLSQDARRYRQFWAGYDVPRHLWHFSAQTMEKLITSQRLNLITTIPMRLDSYYVSLLSEKYKNRKSGLLNMARAVLQGYRSNRAARKTNEYSSLIYIVRK